MKLKKAPKNGVNLNTDHGAIQDLGLRASPNSRAPPIRMFMLTSVPPSFPSASHSPADHCTLCIISYFFSMFPAPSLPTNEEGSLPFITNPLSQCTATHWDVALPLCAKPPYEVDCAASLGRQHHPEPGQALRHPLECGSRPDPPPSLPKSEKGQTEFSGG